MKLGMDESESKAKRALAVRRWRRWWQQAKDKEQGLWWQSIVKELTSAEKTKLIVFIGKKKILSGLPTLVQLLQDETEVIRVRANNQLKKLSMRDFGFQPSQAPMDEPQRTEIAAWHSWLNNTVFTDQESLYLSALEDDRVNNRIRGVNGLAAMKKEKFSAVLISALKDNNVNVRRQAHRALFLITGRKFDFHAEDKKELRAEAVIRWHQWLLDSVDKPRVDLIIEALDVGDIQVRARALMDMNARNPYMAVGCAIDHLLDPAYLVRSQAIKILNGHFHILFNYSPHNDDGDGKAYRNRLRLMRAAQRKWQRWWYLNREHVQFEDKKK